MLGAKTDLRFRPWVALAGLAVPVAFLTILAFFGRIWWVAELASHFRLQYALGATLLAFGVVASRKYAIVTALLALAAVNAAYVLPLYLGRRARAEGTELRCLLLNVMTSSREYAKVADVLDETRPQVVVLLEVDDEWCSQLRRKIDSAYTALWETRPDNFGIAILTTLAPIGSGTHYFGSGGVPSIACTLSTVDAPVVVLATHPLPPKSPSYARGRNSHLEALGRWAAQQTMPVLVVGDLNATPFSPQFRRLLTVSNLSNSQQGFGYQGTWPSTSWALRIPIDHVLHSPRFSVGSRRVGPPIGSDHLPVLAEFRLSAKDAQKKAGAR